MFKTVFHGMNILEIFPDVQFYDYTKVYSRIGLLKKYPNYDLTYSFRELGWNLGAEISPHIYSKSQWVNWSFLPFYKNVEQDKIVLV